ncbi:2971_t:CDS:2, partial [Cetraspora pellucida]
EKKENNFLNSKHREMETDKLWQELFNTSLKLSSQDHSISKILNQNRSKFLRQSVPKNSRLCDTAISAEDRALKANQEKIMHWSLYDRDFEFQVDKISSKNKIDKKKVRTLIYNKIENQLSILHKKRLQDLGLQLPNILQDTLCKKIQRDVKIYKTACLKKTLLETEINALSASRLKKDLPKAKINVPFKSQTETKTLPEKQNNPTHDHVYFYNKILKQNPNLCQEGSNENDDYYGITDESLCLLCKLDHDDDNGIGGRYEVEFYYIKCEQYRIEIE